ncbi:MAG TPA: acetylornithine transaminase [Gammaproteobacteria bacterium]|nr:acetylornithine transaminase [Gammaproteobacteria bacterium]
MKFADYPVKTLMDITARPELVFVRGAGSWLWDHEGKRYLDFVQGWAVNALGHSPRCIVDALAAQAPKLITPSPAFYNEPSLQLAALLTGVSCFDRVFFTNSGAEANEGAIKLARKWGRKHRDGAYEIVTLAHSFHGRTLATMSASGKPGWDTMFAPQVPGFPKAELNDLASVEALIGDQTVAVMLEPVQGEGGVNCATREFMQGLRALCDRHGLLLICDEVQTGVGRLGTLFGYQHFDIEPDIMTLGKGIGGGVPLAALLAKAHASVFEHGEQGGTYNGNPLMTAVGLAVVGEIMQPSFLARVRERGEYLGAALRALSAELGLGAERGIGLLRALELKREIGSAVVTTARDGLAAQPRWDNAGLLLNSPRPALLRFMPALNLTTEEIDLMIDGLRLAVRAQG